VALGVALGAIGAALGAIRVQVGAVRVNLSMLCVRDLVIHVARTALLLQLLLVAGDLRVVRAHGGLVAGLLVRG
jgi:hypothetical protein